MTEKEFLQNASYQEKTGERFSAGIDNDLKSNRNDRKVRINVKGKTGAELLRAYRETETASFFYKWELLEAIEKFTYDFHDAYGLVFDVFLNNSGKYIVFHLYNPKEFSREFIKSFCKEFKVTFESVVREIHSDYEGFEHLGLVTYLFEIIK